MSATPGVRKQTVRRHAVRIIKLAVSIVWFMLCSVRSWINHLLNRATAGTCVVLYYHSVPHNYEARFEKQMRMVAQETKPIMLDGLDNLASNARSVTVTFDDGLESFVNHAVPTLEKFNIPATVFVVSDALGTKPAWGESYYAPEERMMSEAQLRELPELISVGSHSLTHACLPRLSIKAAQEEIKESRKNLEILRQRPVTAFSFPHGELNDSLISQCRNAGYKRVFTINPTLIEANGSEFVFGRVAADPWDWWLEFKLKIRGAYCWQSYL